MSKRILICDDELDNHLIVATALEKYDFEIIDAWDGKQAIELVKTKKPELIIMDYNMPNMDGLEALKTIHGISPETRAILLTGVNLEPGIKQEFEPFLTEYLVKPFDHHELIDAIKKVFKDL